MITTEFQIEPGIRQLSSASEEASQVYHQDPERVRSGIESLSFGLQFRDWLTDHERNLLDMVAPEHAVTFLLHRDRYLHPEDVPLFPPEIIETSLHQGGEAIFIQRYEPRSGYGSDCYKIHTAQVGKVNGGDLILGILGPDRLAGISQHEDYFGRLVTEFRHAWDEAVRCATELRPRLNSDTPSVVINRASGRVVVTTDAAAALLEASSREITGIESRDLLSRIQTIDRGAKFELENIKVGTFHLCVGRIHVAQARSRGTKTGNTKALGFLMHAVRNRLTAAIAAAGHVESVVENKLTPAERGFLTLIQNEILAADRFLQRMKLIQNYESLDRSPLSLEREVEYAIGAIRCELEENVEILRDDPETEALVSAAPGSLQHLFDAIFRSHMTGQKSRCRTTVRASEHDGRTDVTIETLRVDSSGAPSLDRDWSDYADSLADQMGVALNRAGIPDETTSTTITFPVEADK